MLAVPEPEGDSIISVYHLGSYLNLGDSPNLSGSLHSSIGTLTALTYLGIYNTSMNGSLPTALFSALTKLSILDLYRDAFSGTIPATIASSPALTELALSFNRLSGSVPASLSVLTNLRGLYLGENTLNSTVPSYLGSLTSLTLVDVAYNMLTGGVSRCDGQGLSEHCSSTLVAAGAV